MLRGFLEHLHELGWRAADQWLEDYLTAVGKRCTADLSGLLPQKDGSLTAPSVVERKQLSQLSQKPGAHDMKISEVRRSAFAMSLSNPAFPRGPYRFFDRENLIVTCRTDQDALRAVAPGPLGGR